MAEPHFLTLIAQAVQKYPSLRGFVQMPGIAELLIRASKEGWTPDRLSSAFRETDYWKNSTEQSRAWDLLQATDPGTAKQRWDVGWAHATDLRKRLGIRITDAQFLNITTQAIKNGWSDDTLTSALIGQMGNPGANVPAGDLGAAISQVKGLASDYGVAISDQSAFTHARDLLVGAGDAASVADKMKALALSRYGRNKPLVDALERGLSVKQYADPFIQLAVKEVGVNPADVDLAEPKWNAFLSRVDPKSGESMNLDQWQRELRQNDTYGFDKTVGAREQAAQLTGALAQAFGTI